MRLRRYLLMNADQAIVPWGDPRMVLPPSPARLLVPEPVHARMALTNVEAVRMVFEKAQSGDFYPILAESENKVEDEKAFKNFRPIFHGDADRHDAVIKEAGERKTFWNLVSYRPSAIKRKSFTWAKKFARGLYGVFIDFDCGRKPGDKDYDEPGRKLTQEDVWRGVNALIEQKVLPPFQMWADGTRGCYGVMLFDKPYQNIEEAAETWKTLRGYFYRRAEHVAADELARAITQPLKAPGACGVVRYYSTGAERTSMAKLLEWFRAHPHSTDLAETATATHQFTVEQEERFSRAWSKYDEHTKPREEPEKKRRKMTWQQKAAPAKARIDDFKKFVQTYRRCGYSRREFFLDLASALKSHEMARDSDGGRAYDVAMKVCAEVNAMLEQPLSKWQLHEQVYAADPNVRRSTNTIRTDMGITGLIAEKLNLRTLLPPSLRAERVVRDREEKALRAEQRVLNQQKKAAEKEAAKLQRNVDRAERRKKKRATAPRSKKNADRDAQVEAMLREGKPTSDITTATGVHRQQVSRIRERLVAAGEELPEQIALKRGRKKCVTVATGVPSRALPPTAPVCKGQ